MDHDVAAPGPAAIGRAVAATVGRSALVVTVVLLFYYWAPLDRPLDEVIGVLLSAVR